VEVDAEHWRLVKVRVSGVGTLALWIAAVVGGAVLLSAVQLVVLWGVIGPADLGDVDFETLVRRTTPNDALAAPEGLQTARRDITSKDYPVTPAALCDAFHRAVASERNLVRVAASETGLTERYVQRTPLIGFPDTIVVRFICVSGERSSIALYSRSKLGRSDLGANKARLERWLELLGSEVKQPG
jgi:uncharacterized protein (DUF1499 family)